MPQASIKYDATPDQSSPVLREDRRFDYAIHSRTLLCFLQLFIVTNRDRAYYFA